MTFCRFVAPKNKSKRIRYCPEAGSNTLAISKTKCNLKCNRLHFYKEKQPEINKTTLISGCCLVEAMGVEPMSEKSSVQVSPGAGDLQHSRRATPIVRLALW